MMSNGGADDSDGPDDGGIQRSRHAKLRFRQGRPIGQVVNDVQRAGPNDVFIQSDGRFIVRGPKGREHVIETSGEHVTSLHRPQTAHDRKLNGGDRRPATADEFDQLKRFV